MRRVLSMFACVATVLSLTVPAKAASFYGPPELLIVGGYSFPVEGIFSDHWDSGPLVAGGFRSLINPMIMSGIDIGYMWHGLKEDSFPGNPSGGDVGIFQISSETDVFLGGSPNDERPAKIFLNGGLGY